ncbi:MAG TPA: DNRLRE domain-containing protein [Puia sp.]|jgi:hypothetical protein|nr:DNRLRE domain-containing protein [Puia sp.]
MKNIILISALCAFIAFTQTRCVKQNNPPPKADTVFVNETATKTLVVKPGPDDAQDCLVFSVPAGADANQVSNPDFVASAWSYAEEGWPDAAIRGFIEFTALDGLADSAQIRSATLYLYGLDVNAATAIWQGNSDYPGSPYGSTGNQCWLKRVTANWGQNSITWNNMPSTTDIHEATIPESTSQWNNNDTVDVTQMVQDIVNTGQNYGFCLQLQTEQTYRDLAFAGSRNPDSTRWPKLIVTYSIH